MQPQMRPLNLEEGKQIKSNSIVKSNKYESFQ